MRPIVAVAALFAAPLVGAQQTEWLVAPYGWLPAISLDQSADDGDSGGGSVSGSDLLDKTDAVGMIRVEAARNRWGGTLDYIFLALSDQVVIPGLGPLPDVGVRTELDLTVLELAGFWRPTGDDSGMNYLLGIRTIGADKELLVTPEGSPTQSFQSDADFTDVLVGARYLHRFGERWDFTMRADLSFGDTDGTLNLLTSVGYRFPGPFALNLGYRHATIEYSNRVDGVKEDVEIELTGTFVGFVFRF